MKKYGMKLKFRNTDGSTSDRLLQSDNRLKFNTLLLKNFKGRGDIANDLISCDTIDQTTGEVLDHFTGMSIRDEMAQQCKQAGFNMAEMEDENILAEASTTNEEIIAVAKIAIKKYQSTKKFQYLCAVENCYSIMKRRGLKDPDIEVFVKKNNMVEKLVGLVKNTLKMK